MSGLPGNVWPLCHDSLLAKDARIAELESELTTYEVCSCGHMRRYHVIGGCIHRTGTQPDGTLIPCHCMEFRYSEALTPPGLIAALSRTPAAHASQAAKCQTCGNETTASGIPGVRFCVNCGLDHPSAEHASPAFQRGLERAAEIAHHALTSTSSSDPLRTIRQVLANEVRRAIRAEAEAAKEPRP